MILKLNQQQQDAVNESRNVFVAACPGSGKTRVLTQRISRELSELESTKKRVVALTFTNRAAEEIQERLDREYIPLECLWAGTIHSFALEWILRPYACYLSRLRKGFRLIDEFQTETILEKLKEKFNVESLSNGCLKFNRDGNSLALANERALINEYHSYLAQNKLIDFDYLLYLAYKLVSENTEIAKTLGSIIKLICIDEYQDTQDLQYGILSSITINSPSTKLFIVGDEDQAIYQSLGGIAKTYEEICEEFKVGDFVRLELTGNYRSTQRLIDYYLNFCNKTQLISLAKYSTENGVIVFKNQTDHKDDLAQLISKIIKENINRGVSEHEICIVAPWWPLVISLGRSLVAQLPNVKFDAPGLSPFTAKGYDLWFKLSRLFLSEPNPHTYYSRMRWAAEVIHDLEEQTGTALGENFRSSRKLLRIINSINCVHTEGIPFLKQVFEEFLVNIGIDLRQHPVLKSSKNLFFEKAHSRLQAHATIPSDVESMRKMFRYPRGVVINTCHGVKGEEYEAVICFGLLKGMIPNWDVIINRAHEADDEANKLLYVIASRAKKNLYLIAENGRTTRGKNKPYETNPQLRSIDFQYDVLKF